MPSLGNYGHRIHIFVSWTLLSLPDVIVVQPLSIRRGALGLIWKSMHGICGNHNVIKDTKYSRNMVAQNPCKGTPYHSMIEFNIFMETVPSGSYVVWMRQHDRVPGLKKHIVRTC